VKHVEKNLYEAFRLKEGQNRILDLWIDMPQTNPAHENGYLAQHFEKLDNDFFAMHKATKAQGTLI